MVLFFGCLSETSFRLMIMNCEVSKLSRFLVSSHFFCNVPSLARFRPMQGCSACVAISERLAIFYGCPWADSNQASATFWANLIPNALLIKGCAKTLSQVCSVFNQKYYQPFQLACAFSKKIFPSWTQLKAQNCCAPNWSVFSPFGGPLMPPSCNISTFKYFNQPVLNESFF